MSDSTTTGPMSEATSPAPAAQQKPGAVRVVWEDWAADVELRPGWSRAGVTWTFAHTSGASIETRTPAAGFSWIVRPRRKPGFHSEFLRGPRGKISRFKTADAAMRAAERLQ